jgi:hypothetical protein
MQVSSGKCLAREIYHLIENPMVFEVTKPFGRCRIHCITFEKQSKEEKVRRV